MEKEKEKLPSALARLDIEGVSVAPADVGPQPRNIAEEAPEPDAKDEDQGGQPTDRATPHPSQGVSQPLGAGTATHVDEPSHQEDVDNHGDNLEDTTK